MTINEFIKRLSNSEGDAERANFALFMNERCALRGLTQPTLAAATHRCNDYLFERAVTFCYKAVAAWITRPASKGLALLLCVGVMGLTAGQGRAEAQAAPTYLAESGRNPEDIAPLGTSGFAIVSSLIRHPEAEGSFSLLDMKAGQLTRLAVDFTPNAAPSSKRCAGPPGGDFIAHGLSALETAPGHFRLLAINHGRRSVEMFDIALRGEAPLLVWSDCVEIPADISANDLAAYGDGGFALTSFGMRDDPETYDKIVRQQPSGAILEWSPDRGWSDLSRNQFAGPNGVAYDATDDRLIVAVWGTGSLVALDRREGTWRSLTEIADFRPDNLNWTGTDLLVAGQTGDAADILACTAAGGLRCSAAGKIFRFRPSTGEAVELLSTAGTYGSVSVAAREGSRLFAGSFHEDRLAVYPLSDDALKALDQ